MADPVEQWMSGLSPQSGDKPRPPADVDSWMGRLAAPNPPPPAKPESKPGFLTRSIIKSAGGPSFSEMYENSGLRKSMESIIPESVRGSGAEHYIGRTLAAVYRAAPEALDFVSSPAGIGLITLNVIPQTRGFAALADMGMTAMGGKQAVDATRAFMQDKSPENLANVIVSLAQVGLGMTGSKMAERSAQSPARMTAAVEDSVERIRKTREGVERLKTAGPYTEEGDKPPTQTQVLGAKIAEQKDIQSETAESRADELGEMSPTKRFWSKMLDQSARVQPVPILGDLARTVLHPKQDELTAIAHDAIMERAKFEGSIRHEVAQTLHTVRRAVPQDEQAIYTPGADGKIQPANKIAAVVQGTTTADAAGLSPEGRKAVEAIQNLNRRGTELIKAFHGDDASLLDPDTYLTQIWNIPNKDSVSSRATFALMRDRFLKSRTFESYEEGIRAGWTPKYNNITDVIAVRWDHLTRSLANQRFANAFNEMGMVATEQQKAALGLHDWTRLQDVPALFKAAYEGTEKATKRIRGQEVRIERASYRYQPVYVPREVAMAARSVLGQRIEAPGIAAWESVRNFSKKMNLLGSLFHQWAITEQTQALTAGQQGALSGLKKWWFTDPDVYGGAKYGFAEVTGRGKLDDLPVFSINRELSRDGAEHGLNMRTADADREVRNFLRTVGSGKGGWQEAVTTPIRAVGHMQHILERSLWDSYMPAQMLQAYHDGVSSVLHRMGESSDGMPRPTRGPSDNLDQVIARLKRRESFEYAPESERMTAVKRAVAEQVNDAFGAIDYQRMMVHPKVAQVMNWILLAPGWKISNLRVYTQSLEGPLGRQLAMNYARGAAMTWFISAQVGNFLSSALFGGKDKDGNQQPHFSFENPGVPFKIGDYDTGVTSNSFAIQAGYNPNGSERYINWGKGLVDPLHAAMDPHAWFMNALSGPARALGAWAFRVDPVSGYSYVDKYGTPLEQNIQGLQQLLPPFLPFAAREPLQAINDGRFTQIYPKLGGESMIFSVLGLPTRQGLSYSRAKEAYISAMREEDYQAATYILKVAEMNQLKPAAIIKEWKSYRAVQRKKLLPQQLYDITGNPQPLPPPAPAPAPAQE